MTLKDIQFLNGKHNGKMLSVVLVEDYGYLQFLTTLQNRKPTVLNKTIDDVVKYVEDHMHSMRMQYAEAYKPIVHCLQYFQMKRVLKYQKVSSPFVDSMIEKLSSGSVFKGKVVDMLCYVAAKAKGRGNSKIHKETYSNFLSIIESIQELEKNTLENIKKDIKFE
jgi:hypothetical protein